jgi:hypothetical protein
MRTLILISFCLMSIAQATPVERKSGEPMIVAALFQKIFAESCKALPEAEACLNFNAEDILLVIDIQKSESFALCNDCAKIVEVDNQNRIFLAEGDNESFRTQVALRAKGLSREVSPRGEIFNNIFSVNSTSFEFESITGKSYCIGRDGKLVRQDHISSIKNPFDLRSLNKSPSPLVLHAAVSLQKKYNFKSTQALQIAGALETWVLHVKSHLGRTTPTELEQIYSFVLGSTFYDALTAAKMDRVVEITEVAMQKWKLSKNKAELFIDDLLTASLKPLGLILERMK